MKFFFKDQEPIPVNDPPLHRKYGCLLSGALLGTAIVCAGTRIESPEKLYPFLCLASLPAFISVVILKQLFVTIWEKFNDINDRIK